MLAARLFPVIAGRRRLSAALSGSTAAASGVGNGPFATAAITVTPAGGVAPYTYSWTRQSGDASIAISSASSAAPTWSASGTAPQTKGAVWRCAVTDAAGVVVNTTDVTISVQFQVSGLSASVDPTSRNASGTGGGPFLTDRVTVSISGGVGPYTTLWELVSGDNTVQPNDGNIHNPYFQASGTAPQTKNAVWRCKVTDNLGAIAYTQNVNVSIQFNLSSLTVGLDKGSVYGFNPGPGTATTDTVVATPSGGQGPYTYAWEYVGGEGAIFAVTGSSAGTAFTMNSAIPFHFNGTWRCKVTDNLGTIAYSAGVGILMEFEP